MSRVTRRVDPSLVVALLGVAVSAYLTVEHLTASSTLACPEGTVINCAKVTTGPWSVIFGVPVAFLGLAYFVLMVALVSPPAWRRRRFDVIRIVGVVLGALMVLYLVYVELFLVGAICLWCTAVHVLTVTLLGTVLWRTVGREADPD